MSLAPDGIGGEHSDTWLGHEDNYEDNDGHDEILDNGGGYDDAEEDKNLKE